MGESDKDRTVYKRFHYSIMKPQPEPVPINALVAVEGTPMEEQDPVPIWDMKSNDCRCQE